MSAELIIAITILIIALGLSAFAIKTMRSGTYESREEKLARELEKLKKALEVMNEDRVRDREERESDRREIEKLKTELTAAKLRIKELEAIVAKYEDSETEKRTYSDFLLVVLGNDPILKIDLATLRGIKRVTGLNFTRLLNATFEELHRILSEKRLRGTPIRKVLFSVHANGQGLQLDRFVTAEELSAELQDVDIVMIAGCESSAMGQWLSVVPTVITLREAVPTEDASRFVEAYFTALGKGNDPENAFYDAIDKVPTVGEYAEIHTKI